MMMNLHLLDGIDNLKEYCMSLSTDEQEVVLNYIKACEDYKLYNKLDFFTPDQWQLKAFELGSTEPYRMIAAANRIGKTFSRII
ncbi:TPA: hypothetical protein U2I12_000723 [Citrobacter farmeri]|nr:hypothetical protein [Citrobacter farmeri]